MASLYEQELKPPLKFSESFKHVMEFSLGEARRLNHNYIGTEHILLGLTKEETTRRVLQELIPSFDPKKISDNITFIVGRGEKEVEKTTGLTPLARKVIEFAVADAQTTNSSKVNSTHLIIGVIKERRGVAAEVLDKLGIGKKDILRLRRIAQDQERSTETLRQLQSILEDPTISRNTRLALVVTVKQATESARNKQNPQK